MRVRPEQFAALAQASEKDFLQRLVAFLELQFQIASDLPKQELHDSVLASVHRGKGYGLANEQDLATYVLTSFLMGEDFDVQFPAAHTVLTSTILTASDKVRWLEEWSEEIFRTLEEGRK